MSDYNLRITISFFNLSLDDGALNQTRGSIFLVDPLVISRFKPSYLSRKMLAMIITIISFLHFRYIAQSFYGIISF